MCELLLYCPSIGSVFSLTNFTVPEIRPVSSIDVIFKVPLKPFAFMDHVPGLKIVCALAAPKGTTILRPNTRRVTRIGITIDFFKLT